MTDSLQFPGKNKRIKKTGWCRKSPVHDFIMKQLSKEIRKQTFKPILMAAWSLEKQISIPKVLHQVLLGSSIPGNSYFHFNHQLIFVSKT